MSWFGVDLPLSLLWIHSWMMWVIVWGQHIIVLVPKSKQKGLCAQSYDFIWLSLLSCPQMTVAFSLNLTILFYENISMTGVTKQTGLCLHPHDCAQQKWCSLQICPFPCLQKKFRLEKILESGFHLENKNSEETWPCDLIVWVDCCSQHGWPVDTVGEDSDGLGECVKEEVWADQGLLALCVSLFVSFRHKVCNLRHAPLTSLCRALCIKKVVYGGE